MTNVPSHSHQGIEDRISIEMSGIHTELVALRSDTRQGFELLAALQREQGETLREILELLGRPNGGGSDALPT